MSQPGTVANAGLNSKPGQLKKQVIALKVRSKMLNRKKEKAKVIKVVIITLVVILGLLSL